MKAHYEVGLRLIIENNNKDYAHLHKIENKLKFQNNSSLWAIFCVIDENTSKLCKIAICKFMQIFIGDKFLKKIPSLKKNCIEEAW